MLTFSDYICNKNLLNEEQEPVEFTVIGAEGDNLPRRPGDLGAKASLYMKVIKAKSVAELKQKVKVLGDDLTVFAVIDNANNDLVKGVKGWIEDEKEVEEQCMSYFGRVPAEVRKRLSSI